MATILVIDDDETNREGEVAVCERMGHAVHAAASGTEGLAILDRTAIDLIITDLKMDGLDGLGVLREAKTRDPGVVVMIFTGYGTIETAVEAIKSGAFDFVEKPVRVEDLRLKVARALDVQAKQARLEAATELLSGGGRAEDGTFAGMVGKSAAMQRIFQVIDKVAASDASVHIAGESGTGKELIARAIHQRSRRGSGPLISVNCGAIPETLLESELFGHERGAFTGAVKRRLGRFELADGGTIFLDEVGELPLAMQVKLLRVLQDRCVDRVGGERPVKVDVRVIAATNRDLAAEVAAGRFREDLYYRLHVVPIVLPPLRERTDDIIPLARHFVAKLSRRAGHVAREDARHVAREDARHVAREDARHVAREDARSSVITLSPEAEAHLLGYHYPGNVRELENIIEQALVFASPPRIEVGDLPPQVSGARPRLTTVQLPGGDVGLNELLEAAERQMILAAYEASGGVKTETARRLKIKTSALYYKLEKYGIGTIAARDRGAAGESTGSEGEAREDGEPGGEREANGETGGGAPPEPSGTRGT